MRRILTIKPARNSNGKKPWLVDRMASTFHSRRCNVWHEARSIFLSTSPFLPPQIRPHLVQGWSPKLHHVCGHLVLATRLLGEPLTTVGTNAKSPARSKSITPREKSLQPKPSSLGGLPAIRDKIYAAPRSWTERAYPKLIHFNRLDQGGHFAAWEQPALFSTKLRAAFKSLRGVKPAPVNQ